MWRIIPARAGFTGNGFVVCQFVKDHPRSRGVYDLGHLSGLGPVGSSPLARGLPGVNMGVVLGQGIIPARAGFTAPQSRLAGNAEDHPRSRGVYRILLRIILTVNGSSPLARGLPPMASITKCP